MPKYRTRECRGFWIPDDWIAPKIHISDVTIALDEWDEVEDAEDEGIFYYMDGKPLEEGMIISDGFVITSIEGDQNA